MEFLKQLFNYKEATKQIQSIGPKEARENMNSNREIILVDVREDYEFKSGHIKGAKNLPLGTIDGVIEKQVKNKDATVYIYCQSGMRSKRACSILKDKGYTKIYNLGGLSRWPYEISQ